MDDKVREVRPCSTFHCDKFSYFGEFKNQGGQNIPSGTGFYYYPANNSYIMCESMENNVYNGKYFERDIDECLTEAWFYENNKMVGPHLQISGKTGLNYASCAYLNKEGRRHGPMITVTGNDQYVIALFKNGDFTGNIIRFKHGRLFLHWGSTLEKDGTLASMFNCGWDYAFRFFGTGAPRYTNTSFSCRPAYVRNFFDQSTKETTYEYVGGVQFNGKKAAYEQDELEHRTFIDRVNGFAIVPERNGDFYFGGIEPNDKPKGSFYRAGMGCLDEKESGLSIIGEFYNNKLEGAAICKENGAYYFRSYWNNKQEGVEFEMHDDFLLIRSANPGSKKVYKVYFRPECDDYAVEELVNGERVRYADFTVIDTAVLKNQPSKKECINPSKLEWLESLGFTYRISDELELFVTGSKKKEKDLILNVPEFVAGVDKKAFAGMKNLAEFRTAPLTRIIDKGACSGCKNLKKIVIADTIEVIEEDTFKGSGVTFVEFPKSVKLIKNYSFADCKNLKGVRIHNADCVVEPYAFPEGCQINNEGQWKQECEERRKQTEENVAKIVEDIKQGNKSGGKKTKQPREKEFSFVSILLAILGAIAGAILFVPKCIINLFRLPKGWDWTHIVCYAALLLGTITLVLGFTDCLMPIHDFLSEVANEYVPSLFGFRITKAYTTLVSGVLASSKFWGVVLCLFYVIVAPVEFVLNCVVLVLVILCYILYVLYGFLFVYGFGAFLCVSTLASVIKSKHKKLPILALIISIVVTVVFYINFGTFYYVS